MNNPIALILRPNASWLLCLGMLVGFGAFLVGTITFEDLDCQDDESELIWQVELLD